MSKMDFRFLPDSAQRFLRDLSTIKNHSDLTVQGYALDLQMFFRFLKQKRDLVAADVPFDEITVSDLDIGFFKTVTLQDGKDFLFYCQHDRHNNAAARARKATAIRRFFRYISIPSVDFPYLAKNPFQELESPKLRKTVPKYLSLDQSVSLLQSVDGPFRERDYCILTLFLNCGLRISELVGLNLTDIRSDQTLRVLGKGNKERVVHLTPSCQSALRVYLAVRPADDVIDRDALFISRNRRRISVRAVQNVVDKFLEKSGLANQGFSAHKLRHTAATLMYQYGNVDVLLLKEILGHENLSTTEIYTHVADAQIREAMQANPLANISSSPSEDQEN